VAELRLELNESNRGRLIRNEKAQGIWFVLNLTTRQPKQVGKYRLFRNRFVEVQQHVGGGGEGGEFDLLDAAFLEECAAGQNSLDVAS
jgi:hypothetical protein